MATIYKRAHKWKKTKKEKKKREKKRKEKKYTVEVIHTIPQYRMVIESFPVFYERLTDMWLSSLECSVDSLRYIKWRRNNHSSIHVNWNPILYGFPACAKSIRYSLNIA